MAKIQLENVTKRYGKTVALDNISLTVEDNEFFVLFGPAGAGKTTLLKTIAGVEFPQEGLVKIDGEIMNHVEPMYRNISMVFENYALYPQMTVYDNIASPMRSKLYKQDEETIKQEVDRVTKLMGINHLLERRPIQLSNGQRQRVALGRCLVRYPNAFLMDEPLAHLDAKLRHLMRTELKEMQSSIDATTIYVTHDYLEAMSLADRIAVLNNGKIEQIGRALEMYYTPTNEFVAKLFGEPEINIFDVTVEFENGRAKINVLGRCTDLYAEEDVSKTLLSYSTDEFRMGIRGNDISFSFTEHNGCIPGTVYANEPIGNKVIMTVAVGDERIRLVAPNDTKAKLDQPIYITFDMKNAMFFDSETKDYITRSQPELLLSHFDCKE